MLICSSQPPMMSRSRMPLHQARSLSFVCVLLKLELSTQTENPGEFVVFAREKHFTFSSLFMGEDHYTYAPCGARAVNEMLPCVGLLGNWLSRYLLTEPN